MENQNIKERLIELIGSESVVDFILKNDFSLSEEIYKLLILSELKTSVLNKSVNFYIKNNSLAMELFKEYDDIVIQEHGFGYDSFISGDSRMYEGYCDYFWDAVNVEISEGKFNLLKNTIEHHMVYSL